MKYKIILTITMISVLFNMFFLYNWLDRSISLTYSEQSVDDCTNDLSLLTVVVKGELEGKGSEYIKRLFMNEGLTDSLLIKDHVFYLGNIEFIFNNGVLIDVR